MKIYLAIVLDKYGKIKKELRQTDTILEMDKFTQSYSSSLDIRKIYQEEIDDFLKQHKDYINNLKDVAIIEGRKPKMNRGRIAIYGEENGRKFFLPTFYKNYQIPKKISLKRIYTSLNEKKNFEHFLENYRYLLGYSQYINEAISLYKHSLESDKNKYKKIILNELIDIIRNASDEQRYYYYRCLAKICKLVEVVIETKYGALKNINVDDKPKILYHQRFTDDCNDEIFMQFIDNEKYEDLFNNYSIDEILKYSSDNENPLGLRRK